MATPVQVSELDRLRELDMFRPRLSGKLIQLREC